MSLWFYNVDMSVPWTSFVCDHVWVTEIQKFNTAAECYLIHYKSFSKFWVCLFPFISYHCSAGSHPATQVRPQQVASSPQCRRRDKQKHSPLVQWRFMYFIYLFIVFLYFHTPFRQLSDRMLAQSPSLNLQISHRGSVSETTYSFTTPYTLYSEFCVMEIKVRMGK